MAQGKAIRMNNNTAIIIPVYNEEKVIGGVTKSVLKKYKHVICINDGSTDNTAEEIAATSAYLINHPLNMGQGAALQTGIDFARKIPGVEYFVTFDADGQHRIKDVETMLEVLETGKYDIILGSRFLGSKAENMKWSKGIMLKWAIKFSNAMSGLKLTDTHNGLRAFNKHVADTLRITMPDMAHASEIIEIVAEKKYRYKEVPIIVVYTEYSMAKGQTLINAINIGLDMLLRKVAR